MIIVYRGGGVNLWRSCEKVRDPFYFLRGREYDDRRLRGFCRARQRKYRAEGTASRPENGRSVMKRKLQFHGQMSDTFFAAVFIILSGGFQDAYTYCCRGSVFANAQTGNIVLLSAALFRGEWRSCQGALRLFPQSRQADAPRRADLFWCHCRVCRRSGHRKLSDGARRRAGDLGLLRVAFRQLCHDVCPRGQVTRPANFSCAKRKSVLEYDHDFIKEEFRYVEKNP